MSNISQWFYKHIRPALYDVGLLHFLRSRLNKEQREAIATKLGLAGFNRAVAAGKTLPTWVYEKKAKTTIGDGINLVGDLQSDSGVGEVIRHVHEALKTTDIPVAYTEIQYSPLTRRTPLPSDVVYGAPYDISLVDIHFSRFYEEVMDAPSEPFANKYIITYWGWELPQFPDISSQIFKMIDEVWVYSDFVRDSLKRVAPVPVVTMPPAVKVTPSPQASRADFNLPDDAYVFLFSFSPASMLARKNPFGLIEAFEKAFPDPHIRPTLVIKTHHIDQVSQFEVFQRDLTRAMDAVNGILIHDHLTRQQMTDLLNLADCYVSLHRSEGFGLGIAEAMALGKPVIATGYSGNTDFMNSKNSYIVTYKLREITPEDHKYQPEFKMLFNVGQHWAEPDIDHAADLMSYVYTHRHEATATGERAAQTIQAYCQPQAVGERIAKRLQALR